jgi:hypothetical protein
MVNILRHKGNANQNNTVVPYHLSQNHYHQENNRAGNIPQETECLEALSSNPSTTRKEERKEERREGGREGGKKEGRKEGSRNKCWRGCGKEEPIHC